MGPTAGDAGRVAQHAQEQIRQQLRLIEDLPGAVEPSELIVLPDTNALLHDPAIEDWVLGDEALTIVIANEVVRELDRKKVDGNDSVGHKAEGLIRRLKEYARRGDTLGDGVRLAGSRRLREVPDGPDMTAMATGLDAANADDRILATAISESAMHLSSRVVLVTRDRNLQNKARFHGVPAADVADL